MIGIWQSKAGYRIRVIENWNGLWSIEWIGHKGGGLMSTLHIQRNFWRIK